MELFRKLDDADGIANSLWGLAQLGLAEQKVEEAAQRIAEAYRIVLDIGRAEGIAAIGMIYGQLLAPEMPDKALTVLRRSAEMFRKLGLEEPAMKAEKLIDDLGLSSSPDKEAP